MNFQRFKYLTLLTTIAYCCACFLSSGCIIYGAFIYNLDIFYFGNEIVCLWMFNPIVIILSVTGLIKKIQRGFFILCLIISIISWIIAVAMIASVH